MAMTGKTYVDGTDIYAEYGVYVTSGGWNGLVAMPPLKTPDSNDWQEEDGVEVDLDSPALDTREVTVTFACAPDASRMLDFIDALADGAYHEFRCDWIGRTYTLRLVSQSKLSYNPALGTFSLKLADDFPVRADYKYDGPERRVMPGRDDYLIDGAPLTDYDVRVLSGTLSNVLSTPSVKTNLLRNIAGTAGAEYDDAVVTFKSKDVKVQCLMRAETLEGLWRNWDALLHDLTTEGEHLLWCGDAGREFPCFYKSCSVSAFNPVGRIWMQFTLTLTFTRDFRVTNRPRHTFTIVPTPSDATVTINGAVRTSVTVTEGTQVTWSVSKDGYISQSGTQTVTEDTTITVTLADAGSLLTSLSYDDIPAWGGSVLPKVTAMEGAVLTYSGDGVDAATGAVSAGDLGTTVKERSEVAAVTVTATLGGQSASRGCTVWQEANEITDETDETEYGTVTVTGFSYGEIPASGGEVAPGVSYRQTTDVVTTVTYTSGAQARSRASGPTIEDGASLTYSGEGVDASTGAVSAGSLGTTVRERSVVATATVTVTTNGQTATESADVWQAENVVEGEEREAASGELVIVKFYYDDIPAEGGTATPVTEFRYDAEGTVTRTYSSGATETEDGSWSEEVTPELEWVISRMSDYGAVVTDDGSFEWGAATSEVRTLVVSAHVYATYGGQTVHGMAYVYQKGLADVDTHTLTVNLLTDVEARIILYVDDVIYGSFTLAPGTPFVDTFEHGVVVSWWVDATGYVRAEGEVTMDSDKTVDIELEKS